MGDVTIKSGHYPMLNAEVLRVLKTMGNWKPGIQKGRKCRSLVEIPVVFKFS